MVGRFRTPFVWRPGLARAAGALLALGCASGPTPREPARATVDSGGDVVLSPRRGDASERIVRIALATAAAEARVSASGEWRMFADEGRSYVAGGRAGDVWRVERDGWRVRAVRPDGVPTGWLQGPLVVRALQAGSFVVAGGKRYRGEIVVTATDSGLAVVNRVRMDDYLKGVVPLEIGRSRTLAEVAAIEAQAVAARSYAVTRIRAGGMRPWDLVGSVTDQIYGGVDAETEAASRAVDATAGLVLRYGARVVSAPFHSTCGGQTAAATEVWRTGGEPFLQSVSDRIPGTDRAYCDPAPRFRWTVTLDGDALDANVSRYIRGYAAVPAGGPGNVRGVAVTSRTPSGRVGTLGVSTTRGSYTLRGNDARYVLRPPSGEILNSPYFSVHATTGASGLVSRLEIQGTGYGHGVGMCQWGAIGRARAGQDFRTILRTYFPGTTVGLAD